MPYTLDFRVQGSDAGPLRSIADAVQQITNRTKITSQEVKIFDAALKQGVASGLSFDKALRDIARSSDAGAKNIAFLAREVREYVKEQDRAAAASKRAADAAEQAARRQANAAESSARRQATALQSISRAAGIGGIPGGAALGTLGGSGAMGVLAGAGSIAGIIASIAGLASETGKYAREQENLSMRTGLSTQSTQLFTQMAHVAGVNVSSLTTAMRTLSKGMAENSAEGKLAKEALKELGLSSSVAFEPMDKALPKILERLGSLGDAMEKDRIAIELFGRGGLELLPLADRFSGLEVAVRNAAAIMSDEGIAKAAAYERQLSLLEIQWQALKRSLGQKAIGVIEFVTEGNLSPSNLAAKGLTLAAPTSPTLGGIGLAFEAYNQFKNPRAPAAGINPKTGRPYSDDLVSPFATMAQERSNRVQSIIRGGAGRLGRLEGLQEDLSSAEQTLTTAKDNPNASDASVKSARDRVIALKEQIKALEKQQSIIESIAEFEKRMDERDMNPVAKIAADTDDMIRKLGLRGTQAQTVRDAGLRGELAALQKMREGQHLKYVNEQTGMLFDERAIELAPDEKLGGVDLAKGVERFDKQGLEHVRKVTENARSIRNINFGVEREGILRQGQRADRVASLTLSGPGNENAAIQSGYQTRLRLAKQLYDLDAAKAEAEGNDDQKRIDMAKAYADLRKEQQDAELDREMKILELAHKRLDQFKSLAVGFVNAAESHQLPSFFRQQAGKIQDTVVGNAAGMIWPKISGIAGGVGGMSPDSTLGKLFKGTPFGPKGSDPVVDVTKDNTDATALNTRALGDLFSALTGQPSPAASAAGGGVSIPFFGGSSNPASILGPGGTAGFAGGIGSVISVLRSGGGSTGSSSIDIPMFGGGSSASKAGPFTFGDGSSSLAAGMFNDSGGGNFATSAIASAGAAYAGVTSAIHDFKKGGAGGIIGGIGDIAGTAAMFDPEPISKAVLMGVALGSKVLTSLLGDPKVNRQNDITNRLNRNQFQAPVSINAVMDTNGNAVATDRFGNVSSIDSSPFPQVQSPYYDRPYNIGVPGRTTSPIGGSPTVIYAPQITAMDGGDVQRVLDKHADVLTDVIGKAMMNGRAPNMVESLRQLQ